MSIFQKRELSTCGGTEPTPPRAAVCFTTSAMTRRAADWLARLGGCRPLGILSDHGEDVIWQCEAENVDLLLLETDFSPAAEDTKDVSARCDIAIEVRRRLPECKVYLACEDGCLEKLPALDKAVELALIDGYCVGSITPQQMRTWLNEATEPCTDGRAAVTGRAGRMSSPTSDLKTKQQAGIHSDARPVVGDCRLSGKFSAMVRKGVRGKPKKGVLRH